MADCKHEELKIVGSKYHCKEQSCDAVFSRSKVVFVPKSRYQLMQDVREAGRKYHKGRHHKDGCRPSLPHFCTCGRYWLEKALDALEGE